MKTTVLSHKQKRILSILATEAWRLQDPGISADDWRHEQVTAAVQRDGLTVCNQSHYCELMGHFLTAAGREAEALEWFIKNDKNPERQRAWKIAKALEDHTFLATATVEQVTAVTSVRSLKRRLAKREALQDHAEGPITYDYFLSIVRDITHRPSLVLGPDLAASLATQIKFDQLFWILCTLNNRIAEREGTGLISGRNKSQRTPAANARRSPDTIAPRF